MSAPARVRTAVMISGRGSNMEALLAAARAPDHPAEIVLVLSNPPDAGGLKVARAAGVELVALAGYMRVLTPWLVGGWRGRMLNIHPSLLPHFPGLDTHARVLAAGHTRHGATVHWVSEGVDEGPVLGQAEVPVLPGDTAATLAARVVEA